MSRSSLPARFASWPREQQLDYFQYTHTRAGLVARVLAIAGEDISDREIGRHYYLTKADLAAIAISQEGGP